MCTFEPAMENKLKIKDRIFFFFCILLFEPQYKIKAIAEESHTVLDESHMLLEQEYL